MRSNIVRRGLFIAVLAAAPLLASCSSTSSQVSDEIAKQAKDQLDLSTEPTVDCPDDAKAGKGETFTCTLKVDDGSVPIKVEFKDDTNFTSAVDGVVITKANLEKSITQQIEAQNIKVESVTCPAKSLVIIKTGSTVDCDAVDDGGAKATVTVGVNGNGEAEIQNITEQ
jgi:hypothetical protein